MFRKGKVLTLENDKKYIVAGTFAKDGTDYLSLVNVDDNKDIRLCKEVCENNKYFVEDVEDSKELMSLMETLSKNMNFKS